MLYIFIFGYVIGSKIELFDEFSYIDFVLPGILMMNVINASFSQSAFSLYFQRFSRAIEEILTSPLSYIEMIIGYVTGSVLRALLVSSGIYALALLFTEANADHIGLMFFYVIVTSVLFSLLGLIVGLWSKKFEHLSILQTFVITPLIYVGGVFNSIDMLPESLQGIARLNPFFYIVDGLRYSMISFSESNRTLGAIALLTSAALLTLLVQHLFRIGWRLRS